MDNDIIKKRLKPALISSMIVWGIAWPSAKYLTQYAGPVEISFIRFIITALGIFVILKLLKVPLGIKKEGWPYLTLGTLIIAIYNLLFFAGLKKGTPGAGGVLVTTMTPLISYIVLMIIKRQRVSNQTLLGLAVGLLAGLFLLHIWSNANNMLNGGNLFFICSCITWALLSRVTAISFKYGSALAFTWWMYLLCPIVLAPFTNFNALSLLPQTVPIAFWLNLFFNAFINTGIATTIFFFATSKMGAEKTSTYIYIVPFSAALSSYLILGEVMHWYTIIGGLLGILAVYILNINKVKAK